jgi:Flp pilus assembly pilin Flp
VAKLRAISPDEGEARMLSGIFKRICRDDAGASAVEMALICALIVLAMLTALRGFSNETQATWNTVSSKTAAATAAA